MTTDKAWRAWGRTDPYYGVLTDDRFRFGGGEQRETFFARGEQAIEVELSLLARHFGYAPRGRALDFGSGVGRLVIPLARRFGSVVGVDISPDMNAEAARNCAERGLTNVSFVLSDDRLSRIEDDFDFVHSLIVLQHIARRRGERIVREMLARLAPGGAAMIHVSLRRRQTAARRIAYAARHSLPGVHPVLNLLSGRPLRDPPIQMNEYDLPTLLDIFRDAGISAVLVAPEDHGACLTARIYGVRQAPDAA